MKEGIYSPYRKIIYSIRPPLRVKRDLGRSEKQEILIATWRCPAHKREVVHYSLSQVAQKM
ncbi:MAG: hypothetical protein ACP5GN_03340 [Fervidicoccaceae archaeon]